MKGNNFLTSGHVGDRIDKWTGGKENDLCHRTKHGSNYITFAINSIIDRCETLDRMNIPNLEREKIRQQVSKKDQRFMSLRDKETLNKYNQPLTSAPRRNTIQNRSGVEYTSIMLGELHYSQLRTRHLQLVREEYHARSGCQPDKKWGIRELGKKLKAVIIQGQKILIVQRTGCTIESIADDSAELNLLTFKPLLRSRADYDE